MQSLRIGDFNRLKVLQSTTEGFEMEGGVWLAKREVREDVYAGRILDVFLYTGSRQELFATQFEPKVRVGDLGFLRVTDIQEMGAFLDWGLHKELFLPLQEQTRTLKTGDWVSVFVYLDEESRVSASMKVDSFLHPQAPGYREMEEVDLYILRETPLGYTAVVNQATVGVVYKNEVFKPLSEGQKLKGYVRKVREDGKLDLTIHRPGYAENDETAGKILMLLKERGGSLELGDKSDPGLIYEVLGVSKKKFKMALGSLYKKRLVQMNDHSISLKGV